MLSKPLSLPQTAPASAAAIASNWTQTNIHLQKHRITLEDLNNLHATLRQTSSLPQALQLKKQLALYYLFVDNSPELAVAVLENPVNQLERTSSQVTSSRSKMRPNSLSLKLMSRIHAGSLDYEACNLLGYSKMMHDKNACDEQYFILARDHYRHKLQSFLFPEDSVHYHLALAQTHAYLALAKYRKHLKTNKHHLDFKDTINELNQALQYSKPHANRTYAQFILAEIHYIFSLIYKFHYLEQAKTYLQQACDIMRQFCRMTEANHLYQFTYMQALATILPAPNALVVLQSCYVEQYEYYQTKTPEIGTTLLMLGGVYESMKDSNNAIMQYLLALKGNHHPEETNRHIFEKAHQAITNLIGQPELHQQMLLQVSQADPRFAAAKFKSHDLIQQLLQIPTLSSQVKAFIHKIAQEFIESYHIDNRVGLAQELMRECWVNFGNLENNSASRVQRPILQRPHPHLLSQGGMWGATAVESTNNLQTGEILRPPSYWR